MKKWLGVLIFVFGFFAGGAVIHNFPLPFPDKGHRLFEARNEAAAKTLVAILEKNGLRKGWSFNAEPSHQIVMGDKMTVIAWFDKEAGNLPKNTISLAVENPHVSAIHAKMTLLTDGHSASVRQPVKDLPLWLVETDAMVGGGMAFRRPFWKMPSPKIRE